MVGRMGSKSWQDTAEPTTAEPSQRLLTVQDLAAYLDVPVKTIYTWRHRNTGPRGFRMARHLRYRWADVEEWLAELAARDGH